MFSKELYELDKNTVEYMIDEMKKEINRLDAIIAEKTAQIIMKKVLPHL